MVQHEAAKVLLLPYAEGELTHMFEAFVMPMLSPYGISSTHTVNVIGLSEEVIENTLSRLSGRNEFAINIEKHGSEYAVRVSAVAETREMAENICMKAVASVKFALGKAAYAVDSKGIQFEAVALLREKGLSVSTAESCTAGMVSEMLTDVSGSSEVFEYGISAYSNRIKTEVLKVPENVIAEYSAISFETAKAMAVNVRALSGASLGIGITGNAGPSPSEGKPVGLVYVSLADKDTYIVKELQFSATLSRDEIRLAAATAALDMIRCYALAYPDGMAGMMKYAPSPLTEQTNATSAALPIESAPVLKKDAAANSPELTFSENSEFKSSAQKSAEVADSEPISAFTMVFDRDTDEDYYDEATANEYKFTNGFDLSEPIEKFKGVISKFFVGVKSLLPSKGDSPKKLTIKIGFFLSLVVFITSAAVLWTGLSGDKAERDIITSAQSQWHSTVIPENDDKSAAFQPFFEENEDIRGWITISGTKIDNPIYQSSDNDYYLTHNMYKEKSRYGALFFDYRCNLTTERSQNLTVYGHEMKDGSMFGTLKNYKSLSQYKQNPTFTMTTLEKEETYKIFAVMVVNAKREDDDGYLFNYTAPNFKTQKVFMKWVEEARERSIINTNVDVIENDKVVTLVTCINDFDDARFVVMARLVREGENPNVATESASLNPKPRYPKAWYDKRGLEGYVAPSSNIDSSEEASDIPVSSSEVGSATLSDEQSGADSSLVSSAIENPTSAESGSNETA
ncbi:MAG: class B sortase [Clostridia bacterium]|nr:class B sortase [Clostridia bacterium]